MSTSSEVSIGERRPPAVRSRDGVRSRSETRQVETRHVACLVNGRKVPQARRVHAASPPRQQHLRPLARVAAQNQMDVQRLRVPPPAHSPPPRRRVVFTAFLAPATSGHTKCPLGLREYRSPSPLSTSTASLASHVRQSNSSASSATLGIRRPGRYVPSAIRFLTAAVMRSTVSRVEPRPGHVSHAPSPRRARTSGPVGGFSGSTTTVPRPRPGTLTRSPRSRSARQA